MAHSNAELLAKVEQGLAALEYPLQPAELYDPIRYFLSLGGKRIRPVLALMACEAVGGSLDVALSPALGIEVFHNFTLLHDDIMDRAPLRRGKATVHEKWNSNVAILAGDTMFVKAVMLLSQSPLTQREKVMELFLRTAAEVCEGQQFDMNFETQQTVDVADYIEMIRLKTSVLLAASLQIGAALAGANDDLQKDFYIFGENLGIAFQLQDDLLDTYADEKLLGKQIGGDILADKKTFLWLKALELASAEDKAQLLELSSAQSQQGQGKVNAVKTIFERYDIKKRTEAEIASYFAKAMQVFESINIPEEKKIPLLHLAENLYQREF